MWAHCEQVGARVRVCCIMIMDQISGEARHRVGDLLKRTRVLDFDVIIVMVALVEVAEDAHKLPFVRVVELTEGRWCRDHGCED